MSDACKRLIESAVKTYRWESVCRLTVEGSSVISTPLPSAPGLRSEFKGHHES